MNHTFLEKLHRVQADHRSVLCVGLDPDVQRLPAHLLAAHASPAEAIVAFNRAIIEATAPFACAFKLNLAFYEVWGAEGLKALAATLAHIPEGLITIADAKRGDIGNSARFYAQAAYEHLGCDACTVAPYMGRDAVMPFLAYADRAAFVLGRTSNPGGADFQARDCEGMPLYLRVARQVDAWGREAAGTAGLVAGATDLEALAALREACPDAPFLIPGVGAQGGDPLGVMQAAATARGLVLVNSSRQILYADGGEGYAEAAAAAAQALQSTLAAALERS